VEEQLGANCNPSCKTAIAGSKFEVSTANKDMFISWKGAATLDIWLLVLATMAQNQEAARKKS